MALPWLFSRHERQASLWHLTAPPAHTRKRGKHETNPFESPLQTQNCLKQQKNSLSEYSSVGTAFVECVRGICFMVPSFGCVESSRKKLKCHLSTGRRFLTSDETRYCCRGFGRARPPNLSDSKVEDKLECPRLRPCFAKSWQESGETIVILRRG